jgi:hypothetical protein
MQVEPCRRDVVRDVMIVDVSDITITAVLKKIEETSTHGEREPLAVGFYRAR